MRTLELDLTEAENSYLEEITPEGELKKLLENEKLFSKDLLYRGISGQEKAKDVRRYGTDFREYDSIMAHNHNKVFGGKERTIIFDYADYGNPSFILV